MAETTLGQRLAALRRRAAMSMDEVADGAGYRGRSSVQRFFDENYNPDFLPMKVAQALARSMAGKGEPPISEYEVLVLAGAGFSPAVREHVVPDDLAKPGSLARDIPIYGTALGSEGSYDGTDGSGSLSVEQAALDQSEVLGYLRRPQALAGRKDVYAVYISGTSMSPRFEEGEVVLVDPKRPPRIGDDVIVHVTGPDEHEGDRVRAVLVKRLERRSATFLELRQYNPPLTFRISAAQVKSVHRIIPAGELLS